MIRRAFAFLVASLAVAGLLVPGAGRLEADPRPAVRILQPVPEAVVRAHPVLVRGTIEPPDADVAIRLNGQPVFVIQNGEWATLIDLPAGVHTLSAEVRAAGRLLSRAESRVTVPSPIPEEWPLFFNGISWPGIRLYVPIGTPPFDWSFSLDPASQAEGELDPEGFGRMAGVLRRGARHRHTYQKPGFYVPTLRYRDAKGQAFTQQGLVVVFDRDWLEPILQARWAAFLGAVRRNDREEALRLVGGRGRLLLRLAFEEFGPRELAKWADMHGALSLEGLNGLTAVCTVPVDGRPMPVYFDLGSSDGQWRYHHG